MLYEVITTAKAEADAWVLPLRRFDGRLDLSVEQLFAAGEPVGSLKLGARLDSGRLRIAPFIIREGSSVRNNFV